MITNHMNRLAVPVVSTPTSSAPATVSTAPPPAFSAPSPVGFAQLRFCYISIRGHAALQIICRHESGKCAIPILQAILCWHVLCSGKG